MTQQDSHSTQNITLRFEVLPEVDFIQIFQIARSKLSGKSERIHEAIEERPWNLNGVVR
jgi:hypothetical protein